MEPAVDFVQDRPVSLLSIQLSPTMVEAAQIVYKELLDNFHYVRWCIHCKRRYTIWETIGKHLCHGHPGHHDARRGIWSCCGYPVRGGSGTRIGLIDGCTSCDHLDKSVYYEPHQHQTTRKTCIPLLVFLLMRDKDQRKVSAVYHKDYLPTIYKKAFVTAAFGDILEEDEDDNDEYGPYSASFIPPAFKASERDSNAFFDRNEDTFLWHDLRLDDFYVIISHVTTTQEEQ